MHCWRDKTTISTISFVILFPVYTEHPGFSLGTWGSWRSAWSPPPPERQALLFFFFWCLLTLPLWFCTHRSDWRSSGWMCLLLLLFQVSSTCCLPASDDEGTPTFSDSFWRGNWRPQPPPPLCFLLFPQPWLPHGFTRRRWRSSTLSPPQTQSNSGARPMGTPPPPSSGTRMAGSSRGTNASGASR